MERHRPVKLLSNNDIVCAGCEERLGSADYPDEPYGAYHAGKDVGVAIQRHQCRIEEGDA